MKRNEDALEAFRKLGKSYSETLLMAAGKVGWSLQLASNSDEKKDLHTHTHTYTHTDTHTPTRTHLHTRPTYTYMHCLCQFSVGVTAPIAILHQSTLLGYLTVRSHLLAMPISCWRS